jgi:hypothetical protein
MKNQSSLAKEGGKWVLAPLGAFGIVFSVMSTWTAAAQESAGLATVIPGVYVTDEDDATCESANELWVFLPGGDVTLYSGGTENVAESTPPRASVGSWVLGNDDVLKVTFEFALLLEGNTKVAALGPDWALYQGGFAASVEAIDGDLQVQIRSENLGPHTFIRCSAFEAIAQEH